MLRHDKWCAMMYPGQSGEAVECDLVFMSEWKARINVRWQD